MKKSWTNRTSSRNPTIKKVKKKVQPTHGLGENTTHILDKKIVSKICKELLQPNNKKANSQHKN